MTSAETISANSEITDDNFDSSTKVNQTVVPGNPGDLQTVQIDGLLPETEYWVAVRAFDDCHNTSDLATVTFTTADRQTGEVNACFIATAAYGLTMANDVDMLRHVRDAMLRRTVLGELAVETYYTFSPAVAGVIGESDLLRAVARDVLQPIVTLSRTLSL